MISNPNFYSSVSFCQMVYLTIAMNCNIEICAEKRNKTEFPLQLLLPKSHLPFAAKHKKSASSVAAMAVAATAGRRQNFQAVYSSSSSSNIVAEAFYKQASQSLDCFNIQFICEHQSHDVPHTLNAIRCQTTAAAAAASQPAC